MSRHAFFVSGDRIVHIANPSGAGLQYQAQCQVLLPEAQAPACRRETAETMIVVQRGTLEVMINGATAMVGAGSFVRVPPKAWFAYRNAGRDAAQILCRTAPILPVRETCRITIHIAAA